MSLRLEQLVAARTPARCARKICRRFRLALALARAGYRLLRLLLGSCGAATLPLSFPVTPALLPPLFLPLRCRAVMLRRTPTPPLAGRILAAFAAIATQRMGRLEQPLTPLQQASARIPTAGVLLGKGGQGIIRRAHGSACSHRSSLGAERQTRLRGVLIDTSTPA